MPASFTISQQFSVDSAALYHAWLSSEEHTQMTGGEAHCSEYLGDSFSAWDGYISGTNVSLVPHSEIKQTWRTTEFAESDKDSELLITFEDNDLGCTQTLTHTNIPDGQSNYEQGWEDHYFSPMRAYFSKS